MSSSSSPAYCSPLQYVGLPPYRGGFAHSHHPGGQAGWWPNKSNINQIILIKQMKYYFVHRFPEPRRCQETLGPCSASGGGDSWGPVLQVEVQGSCLRLLYRSEHHLLWSIWSKYVTSFIKYSRYSVLKHYDTNKTEDLSLIFYYASKIFDI